MKRILNILFSSKTTIVLLIILVIAMGTGTFIEDKYDTAAARLLVYNAWWFELLFVLLALNFIGHIKPFNMFRKQRIGGVVFHLSFIVMILGAGITRYFGFEGNMRIREGSESNILYSADPYLQISLASQGKTEKREFHTTFSPYVSTSFQTTFQSQEKGPVRFRLKEYIQNATEKIEEQAAGGVDLVELVVATDNGREKFYLEKGTVKKIGPLTIAYNTDQEKNAVRITDNRGVLQIKSPDEMLVQGMDGSAGDTIRSDSVSEFRTRHVYSTGNSTFVFFNSYKNAVKKIVRSESKETGFDAMIFNVTAGDKSTEAPLLFSPGQVAEFHDFTIEGLPVKIAYGKKESELPFYIHLNDFILERYAGSESPSSYASEITVIDKINGVKKDHRIFMNNVLDYENYRFFQSSYDPDEKGTILSVNHDFWGTWVSYFGYFLLAVGFIITLFNPDSRFLSLRRIIVEIRKVRKAAALSILLAAGLVLPAFSESNSSPAIDTKHADAFGHLIAQSMDGRFEPVNSLAYDVLHKLTRKDKLTIEGKGELEAMQIYLDMMADPEFWKQQKIIYIKEQSVRDVIGISTKAAAFVDFFDSESNYKIRKYAEDAFRKKPVEQNTFDKEIIKVDERINIMLMVFQGSILKLFPDPTSPGSKWVSWDEAASNVPLKGVVNIINQDLHLPVLNYRGIMNVYVQRLVEAKSSGNYSAVDKILGYISSLQRQGSSSDLLPSERKINAEVFYNEARIFIVLKNFYALLSLLLLLLAFIDNVRSRKSALIRALLNLCIVLLAGGFIYQTFGMVLRWYLLGYAPWSNGYEALILVAWGTLLAGFSFVRYSKITTAATALLAFFVLMTASHSNYDPQLTNLTPVLKSYWLIIHVAVLTISYGFLGLGFILGIMNLFIYVFKNKNNYIRLDLLISELTYINEMNLTIGIVLATVGTFLGGVWASESWGRYWGWDAKETWALVIVISYTILLHLRFIPKLNGKYVFNVVSVLSFGSVLMTFFGVNYFLSKGMHSYGAGDHAIFPLWAWIAIASVILLMIAANIRERMIHQYIADSSNPEPVE